jgi:NADH dehydrogenase/NADH:ubiquinone oxidoreductase subunit G
LKIKINKKKIEASEGETIIEVAQRNGIAIPALCYAAGYNHQPSCMVCVVRNCETGQVIPSCSTVVEDGMNIDSESEDLMELRRQSLELLLSDHIAACRPPCVPEKCKFRQYANEYRAKWNRFSRYSAIKETQPQHVRDNLWFDVTKCIRCGLCIYNSNNGFTFKERGFSTQVVLPQESVNHVDEILWKICPTQALYRVS